jgi:hypothetical protein
MKGSQVDGASQAGRNLNAVALHNAVLCAECDVVSDSPHDRCLVRRAASIGFDGRISVRVHDQSHPDTIGTVLPPGRSTHGL